MRHSRGALSLLWSASTVIGCGHGLPPAPDASPSIALPDVPVATFPAAAIPRDGGGDSAPADPATLAQTRDVPSAAGAAFEQRVRGLWEAIVSDNPDRAMPFFFPLGAYEQVKDIERPDVDWKRRLVAAYIRDIHALHHRLERQAGIDSAALIGMEVPEARARWVNPGEEYNKIGYFRVFGSRVRYQVGEATFSFEVKSLISWRGTWYVVHLRAIE
jgi:hypothetical protein